MAAHHVSAQLRVLAERARRLAVVPSRPQTHAAVEINGLVGTDTTAADAFAELVRCGCDADLLEGFFLHVRDAQEQTAIPPKAMAARARAARRLAADVRAINFHRDPAVSPLELLRLRMGELGRLQGRRKRATASERAESRRLADDHAALLHLPEALERWANLVGAREHGPFGIPSVEVPRRGCRVDPVDGLLVYELAGGAKLITRRSVPQIDVVRVPDAKRKGIPSLAAASETALVEYVKRATEDERYRLVARLVIAARRGMKNPPTRVVIKEAARLRQQTKRSRAAAKKHGDKQRTKIAHSRHR